MLSARLAAAGPLAPALAPLLPAIQDAWLRSSSGSFVMPGVSERLSLTLQPARSTALAPTPGGAPWRPSNDYDAALVSLALHSALLLGSDAPTALLQTRMARALVAMGAADMRAPQVPIAIAGASILPSRVQSGADAAAAAAAVAAIDGMAPPPPLPSPASAFTGVRSPDALLFDSSAGLSPSVARVLARGARDASVLLATATAAAGAAGGGSGGSGGGGGGVAGGAAWASALGGLHDVLAAHAAPREVARMEATVRLWSELLAEATAGAVAAIGRLGRVPRRLRDAPYGVLSARPCTPAAPLKQRTLLAGLSASAARAAAEPPRSLPALPLLALTAARGARVFGPLARHTTAGFSPSWARAASLPLPRPSLALVVGDTDYVDAARAAQERTIRRLHRTLGNVIIAAAAVETAAVLPTA